VNRLSSVALITLMGAVPAVTGCDIIVREMSSSLTPTVSSKPTFYADVVEQQPKLVGRGCAPYNATVGREYDHESGDRITVKQVLGTGSSCPLVSRPLSIEF